MSIVFLSLSAILLLVLAGAGALFYRRFLARKSKGPTAGAASWSNGSAGVGSELGQSKGVNDVVAWVFGHSQGRVEEWMDGLARALTLQAAKTESQEEHRIRVEKIRNFDSGPQFSNLSTRRLTSEKSLVICGEVLWKRFELVVTLTPNCTSVSGAIYSIDCQVIIFEFQSSVCGSFLSSDDGTIFLTAKFPTPPQMRLEVKQSQEVSVDVVKLERLVRKILSGTEFRFPLSSATGCSRSASIQPELFELQNKVQTTNTSNVVLEQKRNLLVKVIKASGLVTSQERDFGSHQPFCVVLLDSPAQRHVTSSVKNTANPFFDEQFILDLDQSTKKLTFELHDKDRSENDDFLGMAVLTVDDFVQNRHVLPLTGRGPMTFGALTVEVTVVDSTQLASIQASSHNVHHIAPSVIPGSPVVFISNSDLPSSLPNLLPSGSQEDPISSKSLPRLGSLPPKGDAKKKSFVGAIKKRFQRKKGDGSRSQSADRAQEKQRPPHSTLGEGIYLTPPPSRASACIEYDEFPGAEPQSHRSRSNSIRTSLRRLFHIRRQEDSPTRSSAGLGYDHSPEGSIGPPSPRLRPASASRDGSPKPSLGLPPPAAQTQR